MYTLETKNGLCTYKDTMLGIEMTLPEANCAGLVQTRQLPAIDGLDAIEKAFAQPVSGKRLSDIAREKGGKTACILISDATRGIPTAPMAKVAVEELKKAALSFKTLRFSLRSAFTVQQRRRRWSAPSASFTEKSSA